VLGQHCKSPARLGIHNMMSGSMQAHGVRSPVASAASLPSGQRCTGTADFALFADRARDSHRHGRGGSLIMCWICDSIRLQARCFLCSLPSPPLPLPGPVPLDHCRSLARISASTSTGSACHCSSVRPRQAAALRPDPGRRAVSGQRSGGAAGRPPDSADRRSGPGCVPQPADAVASGSQPGPLSGMGEGARPELLASACQPSSSAHLAVSPC